MIAVAQWSGADGGRDTCRLSATAAGWALSGHAEWPGGNVEYHVECDAAWHTCAATIEGRVAKRSVSIDIARIGDGWTMNGTAQPELAGTRDIDLCFSPATNLMPLRRLMASGAAQIIPRAAWLRDDLTLMPLDQTYGRTDNPAHYTYAAAQTGYCTTVQADPTGFITDYPELWTGEVRHAPT